MDEQDRRPLFGPTGRIPAIQAVTLARESGITAVRKGWRLRHTVAMIVLSPLVFLSYNATLAVGVVDPGLTALIVAMSLVASMILTTYLPLRDAERSAASTCGAMPALLVVGAGFLLHQATGPLGGALALAILGLALFQRLSGTSACA
jgi:hypothetical protein